MKNPLEAWKREFVPKQQAILFIMLALIFGYMYGSGQIFAPEEEAIVDLRLQVQIGDKIKLKCTPEESDSLCSIEGRLREGKQTDYTIEWDSGTITKHNGKILGEESIKHANSDYFLHNISLTTFEETRIW
jgi:hypothetical protein